MVTAAVICDSRGIGRELTHRYSADGCREHAIAGTPDYHGAPGTLTYDLHVHVPIVRNAVVISRCGTRIKWPRYHYHCAVCGLCADRHERHACVDSADGELPGIDRPVYGLGTAAVGHVLDYRGKEVAC